MPKLWTEKLARDCVLVGRTVIVVAFFMRFIMKWITADQGTALLGIGMGIIVCAQLIDSRARKTALVQGQEGSAPAPLP
jgi:hypothetical protein